MSMSMSSGSSVTSVTFAITAVSYLRALAMRERESKSFIDSVEKNLDKVNKKVDKFGDKCYDSFNSIANALSSAFDTAKNTISGIVNSFADYGDMITKMSQRTKIVSPGISL